ncbi:hypothetical protein EV401DRAFT_129666 [Pisolithus croceorrhizus]|nr:hypothetical protein EV401DRAFT_129666 [Pisolithus croceorrhizus]
MGKASRESSTKSHFGGVVFEDTQLPIPQRGTIALMQGHGPVLLYQISEHDTRMLVAIKCPIPHDLKVRIALDARPTPSSLRSSKAVGTLKKV